MQITLSNLALTWATAPYFYLAIYGVANVIVISNPGGFFTNLRAYLPLVWAASVAFLLLFIACQKVISPRMHPVYVSLPYINQQHWNMRLMSSVHAIIVALGGAIALCIPEVHKDMLESWHPMVGVLAAIFLGYCALDTYLTLYYHDKALGGGFAIILHHAMVMIIAAYPLNAHKFAMITSLYFLNELSTPFMNQIHFFRDVGMPKDSKLALYNSIVFMIVYFFCRVVVNTYVLFGLLEPTSAGWTYPSWLLLSGGTFIVAFLLLNLYWFYKILAHAVKLLWKGGAKSGGGEQYEVVVDESGMMEESHVESLHLHDQDKVLGDEDERYVSGEEYSLDRYEMA